MLYIFISISIPYYLQINSNLRHILLTSYMCLIPYPTAYLVVVHCLTSTCRLLFFKHCCVVMKYAYFIFTWEALILQFHWRLLLLSFFLLSPPLSLSVSSFSLHSLSAFWHHITRLLNGAQLIYVCMYDQPGHKGHKYATNDIKYQMCAHTCM